MNMFVRGLATQSPLAFLAIAVTAAFLAFATSPAAQTEATGPETISFPSGDGLEITADVYRPHEDTTTPFIVLFHQAGWSRGEYVEIAPRLNELGFNCMAIDQRSGGEVNGVVNETHVRAVKGKMKTEYIDARTDLMATLEFAREEFAKGTMIAWGSSYSAALVLKIAGEHPELIDGVASFAPGEYYESAGKPATWIRDTAGQIEDPVFITSARDEYGNWEAIFEAIGIEEKTAFVPDTDGNHGSRALWAQFDDSSAYWKAVEAFLAGFIE